MFKNLICGLGIGVSVCFFASGIVMADQVYQPPQSNEVHYNWGYGGPPGFPNDNFPASFDQSQNLSAGDYFVQTLADDQVEVNADGTDLINSTNWGKIEQALWLGVSGGYHAIKTNYQEKTGLAYVFSNVVPFDSWLAYYYPNQDLSGAPVASKVISSTGSLKSIHEDDGYNSPAAGVPQDHFSARYTTVKRITAGDYILRAKADDGIRVYIDGKLVVDRWTTDGWGQEDAVKVQISDNSNAPDNQKNIHRIEVQYFDSTGTSSIDVSLDSYTNIFNTNSWVGEVYPNPNLEGNPIILGGNNSSVSIQQLNFNWGSGSPYRTIPNDNFSARFTKTVNLAAGTYLFDANADDSVRVWVDDQLIIDGWAPVYPNQKSKSVDLSEGKHTIKVEYKELSGLANLSVSYRQYSGYTPKTTGDIHYNWGYGSPDPSVPSNYFAATFNQNKTLESGDYFVQTLADDGVKVQADGQTLIDNENWGQISRAVWAGVSKGDHSIKTRYLEKGGQAAVFSDVVPFDSWLAYYYPNKNLDGYPSVTKIITPSNSTNSLHEDNGSNSPAEGIPTDNFSARYTTAKRISAGDYVLRVKADDGVRVYVDGKLAIDRWTTDGWGQEDAVKLQISDQTGVPDDQKDVHWIEVQYFDNIGASSIDMNIEPLSDEISTENWLGEIYPNMNLSGNPVILGGTHSTVSIPDLNFDWKDGSPYRTIPKDQFSARFTKRVNLDTGTYVFNATADDNIRILVDGKVVTDNWDTTNYQPVTKNAIYVSAGEHTVVVEYKENYGNAVLKLDWTKISSDNIFYHYGSDVHYIWGSGSPTPDLPTNNFKALFDQSGWFQGGDYFVQALSDNNVTVNTDVNNLISSTSGGQTQSALWLGVPQGNHTVQTSYTKGTGDAYVFSNVEPLNTWVAYYYSNTDLSGIPKASKVIIPSGQYNELIENNGVGSPVNGVIPADNFSARYTTAKRLTAGDYVIRARADDGVRVLVDGKVVLDRFTSGTFTEDAVKINIQDNNTTNANEKDVHWVEVQYLENTGASKLEFYMQPLSDVQNTDQWVGFVYPNQNLSGTPVVLGGAGAQNSINQLNFDWGTGSPQALIPSDHFSATFVKKANFDGGTYQIKTWSDDGIRVYVDGDLKIDSWVDSGNDYKDVYVSLGQGVHEIKVDYYENTGAASLSVDLPKVTYSSYQEIDLRSRANITAQDIVDFFNRKGHSDSVLKGYAQAFIDAQNKYGVNAAYLVAHAIWETGWGASNLAIYKHNLFGYGAYDSCPFTCGYYFPSIADSINYEAYIVRRDYLEPNGTYYNGPNLVGMNVKYATDPNWNNGIANLMQSLKPFDGSYYTQNNWLSGTTVSPPTFGRNIPSGQPYPTSIVINYSPTKWATVTSTVNYRSLPYVTSSTLLGTLNAGTGVTVVGYDTDASGWYRIIAYGQEVWVSGQYLNIQ